MAKWPTNNISDKQFKKGQMAILPLNAIVTQFKTPASKDVPKVETLKTKAYQPV
jgi:hypothetical protein